jgi:hypothetical protein
MTDLELLELAAKAAGMECRLEQPRGAKEPLWIRARVPGSGDAFPVWNPLTDDGDALRLAVALRKETDVQIHIWEGGCQVDTWRDAPDEHFVDDPNASVRRAIVRAAAEIGRGKQ